MPKCERHGTEMEQDDGAFFCLACEDDPAPDVWVVGRIGDSDKEWEFMGVFEDEPWPGAYYPKASVPSSGADTQGDRL